MSEDKIFSSLTHAPATSAVMSQKKVYSNLMQEVLHGKCGGCGHIDPEKYIQCIGGELICSACRIEHDGKSYCEEHVAELIGDRKMFFILYGLRQKLSKTSILKAASISENDAKNAFDKLKERGYIIAKDFVFFKIKLTDSGILALDTLTRTYGRHDDAKIFLSNVMEMEGK